MRRKDREIKEIGEILRIVDKAKILHLALFDEEFPYLVALHYGYEFIDGKLIFYMHSAKNGHKLDLIRKNSKVCIELETDISLVSGEEIACKYGSNYASVIGKGEAKILDKVEEKIKGLELLMLNQTGKKFIIDEQMTLKVNVIKIDIIDFSAKARRH